MHQFSGVNVIRARLRSLVSFVQHGHYTVVALLMQKLLSLCSRVTLTVINMTEKICVQMSCLFAESNMDTPTI